MDALDFQNYLTHRDDDEQHDPAGHEWGCCLPGACLMQGDHMTSECYTADMAEDYAESMERESAESPPC